MSKLARYNSPLSSIFDFKKDFPKKEDYFFSPVEETLHQFWNEIFKDKTRVLDTFKGKVIYPKADVIERDGTLIFKIAVPGYEQNEIDITLKDDVLTVQGVEKKEESEKLENYLYQELRRSSFIRSWKIAEDVIDDAKKIEAKMMNGILEITIPIIKQSPPNEEDKVLKIKIN